jgi:1,4-alpha-glucan branching enzyme
MPASQVNISANTLMGANLVDGGATFRTWAPGAREVYVVLHDFDIASPNGWCKSPGDLLVQDANGYWSGFFPGVTEGSPYRFWMVGSGGEGFKRDPYARELEMNGYPNCNCIVRSPARYQWHDSGYRPPAFNDLIVYQLHIGVFFAVDTAGNDIRQNRVAKFLDVVNRIKYLADLGVNAIMPLPFQEFQGPNSKGYNGTDLFSPEMDYAVALADLGPYVTIVNQLLADKGCAPLNLADLTGQDEQLKVLIDLCHLYGIAVIADVVFNHAGPGFDNQSMRLYDIPASPQTPDGVYFSNNHHVGPVFAYDQAPVRQFLIDNAVWLLGEYHLDGLRFDQVTVIDQFGGWFFCQDLTSTLRFIKPQAVQIAEYWGNERWRGIVGPPSGMGFDVGYDDRLRDQLRDVISQSAGGRSARMNFDSLRDAMYPPWGFRAWQAFQCIENHDLLDVDHSGNDRQPRIAALSDSTNARSWYARSRSRVATALLLTAPGVPMIFMGQEFLEDKYWSDNPARHDLAIYWAGLEGADKHMSDHHRFTRDLFWLRRKHPALRSDAINVFYVHNDDRIFAFERWLPGVGRNVVVVASLNESTFYDRSYRIGFPVEGHWQEAFNSDIYDNWFNPISQGNYGGVDANGPSMHGLPSSAGVTIPANSVLVFTRDSGDF